MPPVVDTPDWSTPGGGSQAQKIGAVLLPTGTLILGSDGTDARAILVDSSGRIICVGAGGYLSLTGSGRTATPGELDQQGAFTITTDVTDVVGVQITDNGSGGVFIDEEGATGIDLYDGGGGGIRINTLTGLAKITGAGVLIQATGLDVITLDAPVVVVSGTNGATLLSIISSVAAQNVQIELTGAGSSAQIEADTVLINSPFGAGGVTLQASGGVSLDGDNGGNISIGLTTSDKVGFYGAGHVTQHAHPTTLADVIAILTNVGLCA